MNWNKEHESLVEKFYKNGHTAAQIAEIMQSIRPGVTVAAVQAKLCKLGLTNSQARKQRIYKLLAEGHSISEIVRITGYSKRLVMYHVGTPPKKHYPKNPFMCFR